MFIPFANSSGALSGGISSVIFMLWVSIGGNFSRLSGQTVYETKITTTDGCPQAWNVTGTVPTATGSSGLDWWYHLNIYDLSYMWYSGVACMIVMLLGILVSLCTYKKDSPPVDPDLLASGLEKLFCCWPRKMKQWVANKHVFSSHKYAPAVDLEMTQE